MSLHSLLSEKRQELLERWAASAQALVTTPMSQLELIDRMPLFLNELISALKPGVAPLPGGGNANAEEHGAQRLRLGFDIGEVVREYGLLHEAVLETAAAADLAVDAKEARTLASCINQGTRDAVTEYQFQRETELRRQATEHFAFIAHELRNPLASATIAFGIISRQQAGPSSASAALGRSLVHLSTMIDNALSHAALTVGTAPRGERVDLRALADDVKRDVTAECEERGVTITVQAEPIVMYADPRLLRSALSNLVRNAVKFTRPHSTVALRVWNHETRILIEVEDECGGLPPGRSEELFSPFVQRGENRSGFGLGLAIARQAALSHNGTVRVRNLPGHGCVFVLDLPAVGVGRADSTR